MKRRIFLLAFSLLMTSLQAASAPDILNIPVNDIAGKSTTLGAHPGKVILVVNLASKCGYTRQYEGLEALYKKYKDRGLVIAGFPSNEFGGQEPGSDEEILKFCTSKFNVTFPMFSKTTVNGSGAHPLFAALTGSAAGHPGPIKWNFNKFLIGKQSWNKHRNYRHTYYFECFPQKAASEYKRGLQHGRHLPYLRPS